MSGVRPDAVRVTEVSGPKSADWLVQLVSQSMPAWMSFALCGRS